MGGGRPSSLALPGGWVSLSLGAPGRLPLGQNTRRAAVSELVARPRGPEPTAETQGSLPAGPELRQSQPGRARPRGERQASGAREAAGVGALDTGDQRGAVPRYSPLVQTGFWVAQESAPRGRMGQELAGSDCRAPAQAVVQALRAAGPGWCCEGLSLGPQPVTSPVGPGEGGPNGHRGVGGHLQSFPVRPALRGLGLGQSAPPSPPPSSPPPLPLPLPLWPG